jgi:hypothetical protein
MGGRGRAAIQAGLNWEREAPLLLTLYRALEEGSGVQPAADKQTPAPPTEPKGVTEVAEPGAVLS